MRVPEGLESVLSIDPEIMHGELCFKGTRVPVEVFFGNQTEGMGAEEFVAAYPTVERHQVDAVIAWQQTQFVTIAELEKAS